MAIGSEGEGIAKRLLFDHLPLHLSSIKPALYAAPENRTVGEGDAGGKSLPRVDGQFAMRAEHCEASLLSITSQLKRLDDFRELAISQSRSRSKDGRLAALRLQFEQLKFDLKEAAAIENFARQVVEGDAIIREVTDPSSKDKAGTIRARELEQQVNDKKDAAKAVKADNDDIRAAIEKLVADVAGSLAGIEACQKDAGPLLEDCRHELQALQDVTRLPSSEDEEKESSLETLLKEQEGVSAELQQEETRILEGDRQASQRQAALVEQRGLQEARLRDLQQESAQLAARGQVSNSGAAELARAQHLIYVLQVAGGLSVLEVRGNRVSVLVKTHLAGQSSPLEHRVDMEVSLDTGAIQTAEVTPPGNALDDIVTLATGGKWHAAAFLRELKHRIVAHHAQLAAVAQVAQGARCQIEVVGVSTIRATWKVGAVATIAAGPDWPLLAAPLRVAAVEVPVANMRNIQQEAVLNLVSQINGRGEQERSCLLATIMCIEQGLSRLATSSSVFS